MDIITAASLLAKQLGPPAYHSVYVNTEVDPDTQEFVKTIHVAVRPAYKSRITVPAQADGYPVKQVPWPKSD